jgi:hypothetical protein
MRVIDEFDISDNQKLRCQVGEYRGSERIDIRQYIKVGGDDEFKPTKKGINFNREWIDNFLSMVDKLKDD